MERFTALLETEDATYLRVYLAKRKIKPQDLMNNVIQALRDADAEGEEVFPAAPAVPRVKLDIALTTPKQVAGKVAGLKKKASKPAAVKPALKGAMPIDLSKKAQASGRSRA